MLKLFFSDVRPRAARPQIRAMRLGRSASWPSCVRSRPGPQAPPGQALTLQLGISYDRVVLDWCEATEHRLAAETDKE